mgnify:CR=1 FL=1
MHMVADFALKRLPKSSPVWVLLWPAMATSGATTERLYRVRRTVLQMIRDRGYMVDQADIDESEDSFKEKAGTMPNREEMTILVQKKDNPTDQIFVFWPSDPKIGVKPIQRWRRRSTLPPCVPPLRRHWWLVASERLVTRAQVLREDEGGRGQAGHHHRAAADDQLRERKGVAGVWCRGTVALSTGSGRLVHALSSAVARTRRLLRLTLTARWTQPVF